MNRIRQGELALRCLAHQLKKNTRQRSRAEAAIRTVCKTTAEATQLKEAARKTALGKRVHSKHEGSLALRCIRLSRPAFGRKIETVARRLRASRQETMTFILILLSSTSDELRRSYHPEPMRGHSGIDLDTLDRLADQI